MAMQHDDALQKTHRTKNTMRKRSTNPRRRTRCWPSAGSAHLYQRDKRLNLQAPENLQIGLNLNEHLLHAFCHQIIPLTEKAEWGVAVGVGDPNIRE